MIVPGARLSPCLKNKKNPLIFSRKKLFLYFGKMELSYFGKWNFKAHLRKNKKNPPEKISYISGHGTFYTYITLIFQEVTFPAQKIKKTHSQKVPYISGNGTF